MLLIKWSRLLLTHVAVDIIEDIGSFVTLVYLFNDKGSPIEIPIDLSFPLYDISEAGSAIWTWFL